jgi:hypothetical protein
LTRLRPGAGGKRNGVRGERRAEEKEFNMKRKTTMKPDQPLKHELLMLVDDFAEHTCISAFLLSALPAVMSSDDAQRPEVIEGAKLYANILQSRTREMKRRLDHAYERCRAEQDKTDSSDR